MITAPTVIALVAIAIFASIIVAGIAMFSPGRSAATILAEAPPDLRAEQLALLRSRPHEASRRDRHRQWKRIDRDDVYVGVLIALWFAGLGIMVTPIGSGTIATLEVSTQKLLAICMVIGASIALLGSASGRPTLRVTWPFRMVAKLFGRLFRHATDPVEIRHAYLMGAGGLIAFNASLFCLAWTIITNSTVVGTATGILTPILFVVYTKKMRKLFAEFRRLTISFNEVKEAVTRTDKAGDP
jgi:hypothetical protein